MGRARRAETSGAGGEAARGRQGGRRPAPPVPRRLPARRAGAHHARVVRLGEYYCAKDRGATVARCRYATTGTGDFRTGRRASGWEVSPLGRLYNPIYFNGGIAFHGALDVPRYPASHGCVRLPMHIAEYFPKLVKTNVAVHVRRPK
ncbi:L,D-transpeptidase family protein [Actinomadura yumaensis]|uniref:L,D-transpeptidase n=1 Tax=Actinomadura yumaensis TaxID=111807 RepID=UPI0036213E95